MLTLSLDRSSNGVVQIAWRSDGRAGPPGLEDGVQTLVAGPGRECFVFGEGDWTDVPYVVRDIAETVCLETVRGKSGWQFLAAARHKAAPGLPQPVARFLQWFKRRGRGASA